jgi:hypothetical protein
MLYSFMYATPQVRHFVLTFWPWLLLYGKSASTFTFLHDEHLLAAAPFNVGRFLLALEEAAHDLLQYF